MKYVKISILIFITTFFVFVIYKAIKSKEEQIPTISPQYRNIMETLTISGRIEPFKEIEVKSPISGILEKLYVNVGEEIKIGEPIAKVQFVKDPLEYKNLLKQLEIKKAQHEQQTNHFKRITLLYQKNFLSQEEYEHEHSLFLVSESELDAISSEVQMVQGLYLQDGITNIVKATGSGTILQLPIKEGGSVMARGTLSEGTTIVRIADLQSLVFKGFVLESDVVKVKKNADVKIRFATNSKVFVNGKIVLVAPKAEKIDDAVRFEVTAFVNVDDSLRQFLLAGCSATAELVYAKKENVLSIDEKYLLFDGDSVYVEVLNNGKKFNKRYVQTGISDGIFTEIINGIDSTAQIKK